MRSVRLILLLLVVVAAACSSGVSDEDYEAALQDARNANARVGELESSLTATEERVSALEGDLSDEEAAKSAAEDRVDSLGSQLDAARNDVDRLETELTAASDATARAEARFGELVDLSAVPFEPAATLVAVLARGTVLCGVNSSLPGFSEISPSGSAAGFDADYCRAIAAAVLGDAEAVEFVPVGGRDRFDALRFGVVDVVIRNTTWTLGRDAARGDTADFGPTTFYDGQQFLGRSDQFSATSGPADIDGARLCVPPDSGPERNAVAFAATGGSTLTIVPDTENLETKVARVASGTCDLITGDGTGLASFAFRAEREGNVRAGDLVVFPSLPISREPLGPAYRQGDTVWADIVNWVVFATIIAEEKGIDSANIDAVDWDDETRRLFGVDGDLVAMLGLDADAFYQVVKQVGNFGEIFDSNLGPLGFTREGSPNALYTDGGLIYAPPAR